MKKYLICIIILLTCLNIFFYKDRTLGYEQNNLSIPLDVFAPYKWNEKGFRVVILQLSIGLRPNGIYDSRTQEKHYSYLKNIGAPTNNIPTPAQTTIFTDEVICKASQARIFAHQILDPHNIPIPFITVVSNAKDSFYGPGSDAIFMPPCETKSGIAHEIGHYVHARAFGFNWNLAVDDAAKNFTGNDWIVAQETTPGIEHAAHCIGYVLWQKGAYTKCPDSTMRSYAAKIIAQAG